MSLKIPSLSLNASSNASSWWVGRLNDIFSVLADPAIFTDRRGIYVPAKHLHALLTVEQLFRRVFSIQANYRDSNARRTLLFTVPDTLERLTSGFRQCSADLDRLHIKSAFDLEG